MCNEAIFGEDVIVVSNNCKKGKGLDQFNISLQGLATMCNSGQQQIVAKVECAHPRPVLPSCSVIFTRSDPPTTPTVTCCSQDENDTVILLETRIASRSRRMCDPNSHLAQLLHELKHLRRHRLSQRSTRLLFQRNSAGLATT